MTWRFEAIGIRLLKTSRLTVWTFFVAWLMVAGCRSSRSGDAAYIAEIKEWQKKRIESLTKEDSWLSLAGLFWLKEGENRFGSEPSNDIIFPAGKAPAHMGTFVLQKGVVTVEIEPGVQVLHQGEPVRTLRLRNDTEGEPTILTYGSLSWFIIQRGERYGVRLRDRENPHLRQFKGIDTFPIDPAWRIEAVFEPYDPPKIIEVPTILGTVIHEPSPGALVFTIEGSSYRLEPTAEPDDEELFVVFADQTNGAETYGGGRFVYVKRPGKDGRTVIDFNKAYNPPCAFTEFATCPLPPEGNRLPIRVTAGEKKYAGSRH